MLSPVPEKYLPFTNDMNTPVGVPGPLGIFSAKKCFTAHIEMGYQLDYLRVQGGVKVNNNQVEVLTQTYTHTFQVQYNFKRNDEFKPLFNYYLYYKMGGISVKNDRVESPSDGAVLGSVKHGTQLNSNVAIMSGIGAGINYQLNSHLSLTGSLDANRSADAVGEIFKPHTIFFSSSHSVNNYIEFAVGLSWWFNFSKKKKSAYFHPRNPTDRELIKSKIEKKKGQSSPLNNPIWYDSQKKKWNWD